MQEEVYRNVPDLLRQAVRTFRNQYLQVFPFNIFFCVKYDYDYMTCRWLLESSLVPGTRTNFVTFTSELRDLRYWHVENLMYWCIFVWRIFHWLINVFIWFVRVDLYAFDKFWIKHFSVPNFEYYTVSRDRIVFKPTTKNSWFDCKWIYVHFHDQLQRA